MTSFQHFVFILWSDSKRVTLLSDFILSLDFLITHTQHNCQVLVTTASEKLKTFHRIRSTADILCLHFRLQQKIQMKSETNRLKKQFLTQSHPSLSTFSMCCFNFLVCVWMFPFDFVFLFELFYLFIYQRGVHLISLYKLHWQ